MCFKGGDQGLLRQTGLGELVAVTDLLVEDGATAVVMMRSADGLVEVGREVMLVSGPAGTVVVSLH